MRTDVAKRVRIANRLSGMHVSAKSEILRAWRTSEQRVKAEAYSYIASDETSKSKTGCHVVTGEGEN